MPESDANSNGAPPLYVADPAQFSDTPTAAIPSGKAFVGDAAQFSANPRAPQKPAYVGDPANFSETPTAPIPTGPAFVGDSSQFSDMPGPTPPGRAPLPTSRISGDMSYRTGISDPLPPGTRYDRFGEPIDQGSLDAPTQAIVSGVERLGRGLTATRNTGAMPIPLETGKPQPLPQGDVNEVLGGINSIAAGLSAPVLPITLAGSLLFEPEVAIPAFLTGTASQQLVKRGLEAAGATPEAAEFGGNAAFLLGTAGVAGVQGVLRGRALTDAEVATHWQNLGDELEPGRLQAGPSADTFGVMLKGPNGPEPAEVRFAGRSEDGETVRQVVRLRDGKVVHGGTDRMNAEWLGRNAYEGNWLTRLQQGTPAEAPPIPATEATPAQVQQLKQEEIFGEGAQRGLKPETSEPGSPNGPAPGGTPPETRYIVDPESGELTTNHQAQAEAVPVTRDWPGAGEITPEQIDKAIADAAARKKAAAEAAAVQKDEGEESELTALEGAEASEHGSAGEKPENTGAPETATLENSGDDIRGRGERGVSGAVAASPRPALAVGRETTVLVPGEDIEIPARYEVWSLRNLIPSHSGLTFLPSADYGLKNERRYDAPENQQRVLNQGDEEKFRSRYLITDNPDALNGPPIVLRETGELIAGNSRGMAMQIVFARNGKAAASYRQDLNDQAAHYGVSPESWAGEDQPMLVRVVDAKDLAALPGGSKWAIRKTNVAGTAALSASERATADAGQLTPEAMEDIANTIEQAGPGATLNDALTGRSGTALVNQLIAQGFFSEQERPALMDGKTGALTQAAKDRISKALLGQFFADSDQYQRFPAAIKQKLERVAAPLATVAGDPAWDLLPQVREAVNLIEYAEAHGIKNLSDVVAQRDMFGKEKSPWSQRAVTLAEVLKNAKPNDVVAAFRRYVASKEPTMFGDSTPDEAFQDAFEGGGPRLLADLDHRFAEDSFWKIFYSQLERVIETKMPAKVSPAQALAILQNPQHGVKAEELKWTGLADWLKKQTGMLTRDAILTQAEAEGVDVREQLKDTTRYEKWMLGGEHAHYQELLFTWHPKRPETPAYRAYRALFDKLQARYGGRRYNPTPEFPGGWEWFQSGAVRHDDPLTPEERDEYEAAVEAWDNESDRDFHASTYQSPHWREENVLAHTRFDTRTDDQGRRVLFIEEIQSDWHQEGRKKGYRAALPPFPGNYQQWGLAHGMSVEEVNDTWQTEDPRYREWHRELLAYHEREREIRRGVVDAPFKTTWHELVFRRLAHWAAANGYDALAWTTGAQQARRYDLATFVSGVAFRPTTDPYLVDREVRDHGPLAEGDQIGFLYTRRQPRKGEDADLLDWETPGPAQRGNELIRASELPEYVGKAIAQKLLAQPLTHVPNTERQAQHQLTGESLQVGGHGMSGFYDSILPAYAAKFGKKWGAQVGLAKLDIARRPEPTEHYRGPAYRYEQVVAAREAARADALHRSFTSPFTGAPIRRALGEYAAVLMQLEDRMLGIGLPFHQAVDQTDPQGLAELLGGEVFADQAKVKPQYESVHTLAITPGMRKSIVDEGMPLFARELKGEGYNPERHYSNQDLIRDADWEAYPANNRRVARMRLNWQAGKLLANVIRVPFFGLTLDEALLRSYAERVRLYAQLWQQARANRISAEQAARMQAFAEALDGLAAAAQAKPIYLYRDRASEQTSFAPGERLGAIRRTAATKREELTHVQQAIHTRSLERGQHIRPQELRLALAQNSIWPKLSEALERRGYPRHDVEGQIIEAGAKLIAGKHAELGVTEEEADLWLKLYRAALEQTHGTRAANEVFRYADPRFSLKEGAPQDASNSRPDHRKDAALDRGPESDAERRPDTGGSTRRGGPDSPGAADLSGEAEPSLFGAAETGAVSEAAARDRERLEGERLTAQFKAPLTRAEQLKKLKRSQENPQSGLFEENEEPPQGALFDKAERGSIDADLATLGLTQFVKHDVIPNAKVARLAIAAAKDDLLKLLAPAARAGAAPAALSVRHRAAELQRATDRARAALRIAGRYFDSQEAASNYDFIERMEQGEKQQTPELEQFAGLMREILDTRREAIRALGKGKLEHFIENYFPHIWKKPGAAADFYANYGKRPLEGAKAFLKKRSIDSFAAGIEHGLEPVSDNPVDLVLQKAREMDKYLTAQRILDDLKQKGVLKYVDARDEKIRTALRHAGWVQIEDPSATVYGQSVQPITEYPNEGLWDALGKVADALGVEHERGFLNLRGAVGRAGRDGSVRTLHGTAEDVLAHEIGHQIDFRAGSGKKFIEEYPDAETVRRLKRARKALKDTKLSTPEERKFARQELKDLAPAIARRKAFAKELRDLADLRSGPADYTHKREEKMAQLAEMWVGARELFARTAPTVFKEWKAFLDANPKLHALRDIEGNTEVKAISQPYDVGGLVIKGHWWAPEAAATIVNHYLSPGLREKSGLYRAYQSLGNLVNAAQLGFSAFHLGFTTFDVTTSKLALAIYQMGHGDFAKGLKNAALTPLAPFSNIMRGDKLLKAWYEPGTQGGNLAELVDALMRAGGRAHMDAFYETKITQNLLKALRAFNLPGALLRFPGALLEQTARPIMEWVVPRQKLGVFADLARYELDRLGPDADPEQVQAALARAWDSVDNRLGELVYDNLFWHKVIKDLALVSVRSVGWNVGTIRELAGAGPDAVKFAKAKLGGKAGEGSDFTPRMSYALALPIVAGLIGAIAYYLWHGSAPKHLKDYYAVPDAHGHRYEFPTYMKDALAWGHDPVGTARGKIHPFLDEIMEMLSNKDFFGRPIRNPHHKLTKQAEEVAAWAVKEFTPLAYRNDKKGHHPKPEERVLGFFGVKPAPKWLQKPATH